MNQLSFLVYGLVGDALEIFDRSRLDELVVSVLLSWELYRFCGWLSEHSRYAIWQSIEALSLAPIVFYVLWLHKRARRRREVN